MPPTTLRDQLIRDEGCRLRIYTDSLGHPTIGVGRALDTKGISLAEADMLLDNDIRDFTAAVLTELPWAMQLDDVRRAALINMAFNLGVAGFLKFERTLQAVERGDYDRAAKHMLESKWAGQVGLRADRLAEQMRTGEWR